MRSRRRSKRAVCAGRIGGADVFEIDQINILPGLPPGHAPRRRSASLSAPIFLLIDAVTIDLPIEQLPLIDGDARCRAIAAASIVAKVHRDAVPCGWDRVFPQYNLASNKGYSTPDHRARFAGSMDPRSCIASVSGPFD